MAKPQSLVLITVDCLRADHVGFMGYDRPTTPFLDSLAAESLIFKNAIVAGAPTYHSLPAIMAARYPLALGRDVLGVSPDEPTIASVLSQMGYTTAAFTAANPYISKRFGYSAGFDTFSDFTEEKKMGTSAHGSTSERNRQFRGRLNRTLADMSHKFRLMGAVYDELHFRYGQKMASRSAETFDTLRRFPAADLLVSQASNWLKSLAGGPFFLWLHLMDPHGPYYPPQEALDLLGWRISPARARYVNSYWLRGGLKTKRLLPYRDEIVGLYDSGIRWVDEQISALAKSLRGLGLWDNCLFAVTADHGEEFLDHGGTAHTPPSVSEEITHVPLLLRVPGGAPRKLSEPFSLLHLAPTLLDALRVPVPEEFSAGSRWKSVECGDWKNSDAVVECINGCRNPFRGRDRRGDRILAVRESRYKLAINFHSRSEELFDLESDPSETRPLPSNIAKHVRWRLLERARKHIADSLGSRNIGLRIPLLLRSSLLEGAEEA